MHIEVHKLNLGTWLVRILKRKPSNCSSSKSKWIQQANIPVNTTHPVELQPWSQPNLSWVTFWPKPGLAIGNSQSYMCVATIRNSHNSGWSYMDWTWSNRTYQAEALFQEAVELRGLDASALAVWIFATIEAYTASYIIYIYICTQHDTLRALSKVLTWSLMTALAKIWVPDCFKKPLRRAIICCIMTMILTMVHQCLSITRYIIKQGNNKQPGF